MNYHPTLARPESCRVAVYEEAEGMIHLRGIGCWSSMNHERCPSIRTARERIQHLVNAGTVCCGLLKDTFGQFWNERGVAIGHRHGTPMPEWFDTAPRCEHCSAPLTSGNEQERGECSTCQKYHAE